MNRTNRTYFFMLKISALMVFFGLVFFLYSLIAQAADGIAPGRGHHHADKNSHSLQTLAGAVTRVRKKTGGKVLRANAYTLENNAWYVIKVLMPKGNVRVVSLQSDKVDQTSGGQY